jgi:hypothetical protein
MSEHAALTMSSAAPSPVPNVHPLSTPRGLGLCALPLTPPNRSVSGG